MLSLLKPISVLMLMLSSSCCVLHTVSRRHGDTPGRREYRHRAKDSRGGGSYRADYMDGKSFISLAEGKPSLINSPDHQQIVSRLRSQSFEILKQSGGMYIPLYPARPGQQNLRRQGGSKAAEFPSHLIKK